LSDIAASSREIIRKGSKSFAAAARLFDSETRNDVYLLYAWCRYCDDLIDGQELGFGHTEISEDEAQARLAGLRSATMDAVKGHPVDEPAFIGLQKVVTKYQIPARYPLELIDGFAMDVAGKQYRTLEDTLLYCYHVAGVVGVMMAFVMGVRQPEVLSRAADLGIAFQLTNISRDVMDDAANDRSYLPADWLREAGVPDGKIADPDQREAVFTVVRRLLKTADRYYASAADGIRALGFRAGWAISTASGVYRDIGSLVLSRGPRAWDERAYVSTSRKLLWGLRGVGRALTAVSFERRREAPPRAADLWIKPDLC
jgi:phytoene synthase